MALIQIYSFIALVTALTALVVFFLPLVAEARARQVSNSLTESTILAPLVFVVVCFIFAPFVLGPILFPAQGELFRVGLQRVIEQPDD